MCVHTAGTLFPQQAAWHPMMETVRAAAN